VAIATNVEHLREDFGLISETTDDEVLEGQITYWGYMRALTLNLASQTESQGENS